MKVIVKKEYDTAEVVEKLEKVLRKSMADKAQVIIDKDDVKAIVDIIKYFDNDYQVYKSETLKKAEELEEEVERFKAQREQQESSVDKKETCDDCVLKYTGKCNCDCSIERMTVADVKVIHDCFVNFTIGESWERECDKCDFKLPCICMSMKKCMEGKCNG